MARIIIVEGKSGTGKTTGLRNLPPKETFVLSPNGKGMSFPGWKSIFTPFDTKTGTGNLMRVKDLSALATTIKQIEQGAKHIKYLVVDDYTHYFTHRTLSPQFLAQNSGGAVFSRWNVFGADVFNSFWSKASEMREDLTIIVNHHTTIKEDGTLGFKTSGKLLDNEVDCPSQVEYIFHTRVLIENDKRVYKYMTNTDGVFEAKSPMGCFEELFIDNDIYAAIQQIEKYELGQ